jgi:NADPH-dependent glutamate synthase beta subunit-like oxidoreductase
METVAVRFRVKVPDEEYWRKQIKCQFACPVHTDARGYVRAIATGDYQRAYLIARGPNPLASICGRVCGAPCEVACRRGSIDKAVSIRALKRFVTDPFIGRPTSFTSFLPDECDGLEEVVHLARYLASREYRPPATAARVAIIGSGPAGLAAAHDLALLGFSPVVFEMESRPAGMLYTGIPAYRLPRELIDAEVELIRALGVEFRCGVIVGCDVSFADLRRQFRAVIIAVGAKRARLLALPGSDAEGIYGGIDFLRAVAVGETIPIGRRVIVVGGGNVAYDVSRSAVRYAGEEEDASRHVDWQTETDVSRIAARQPAVREVHLVCLESREEMPADEVEIVEGEEEGIHRHNSLGPKEFLFTEQNGKKRVTGVRFRRVLRVFDENRRFAPVYNDTATVDLEADTVLLSVGQMADLSFVGNIQFLTLDSETLATDMEGVFAAGDVAYGARLMIDAIASGKKAARSVYRYITGQEVRPEEIQLHFEIEGYGRERGYEGRPRTHIPTSTPAERLADPRCLVELGYTEVQAQAEAGRCLDCGINTIFDGEKCILCGGCVDVCPTLCLKLVGLEQLASSEEVSALLGAYGTEPGWSAILKDEDRCIRCALCAQRCPTHAITMERFQFLQEWCHA